MGDAVVSVLYHDFCSLQCQSVPTGVSSMVHTGSVMGRNVLSKHSVPSEGLLC